MSKILDIPAVEAFNCNTAGNLVSEWEKWKKRYYVTAAGLSDSKQKRAVLLPLNKSSRAGNFRHSF